MLHPKLFISSGSDMKGVEGGERTRQDSTFPLVLGARALTLPLPPCHRLLPWTLALTAVAKEAGRIYRGRGLLRLNEVEVREIDSDNFL